MSLTLSSSTRRYLIAGDCVSCYGNWTGDADLARIPSGPFTSLEDYTSTFEKIELLDCEVMPSHDLTVAGYPPSYDSAPPWP
jgi:N-acyl homoserine lactone hydrolase